MARSGPGAALYLELISGTRRAEGSPRKQLLLPAAKRSLSRLFGGRWGGELARSWSDAEKGAEDPQPFLQRLDILTSVVCVVVVIILILLTVQQTWRRSLYSPAEPCPEDWMYHQRQCYYFSDAEADWEKSKDFCFSHGAGLLLINNKKEMNFITTQMWMPSVWIGLHKTDKEILWLNGSAFDNQLFEVHGKGKCVYIQSKVAAFSDCTVPKNWVCRKEPHQTEDNT